MRKDDPFRQIKLHEQIDWSIFCLTMMHEAWQKAQPKSNIEIMIDNATGFSANYDMQTAIDAIYHVRRIVKYKKLLNAEFGTEYSTAESEANIKSMAKLIKEFKKKINNPPH